MIYYRRKNGIKMAEIWYNYHEKPDRKVDVLRYKFVGERKEKSASFQEEWTILHNLEKPEEEIFGDIHRTCKYHINHAKNKDAINCVTFLERGEKNEEKLAGYIGFFNAFAKSKNRGRIHFADLEQFYNNATFCVRSAFNMGGGGEALTMHAYIISDNTARLYQSSSLFRNSEDGEYKKLVARANKLLHWEDMLHFKKSGVKWYDFGGWFSGEAVNENFREQLLINKFKESFGGEKKQHGYSFIEPASFLGKIAVSVHGFKRKLTLLKNGGGS